MSERIYGGRRSGVQIGRRTFVQGLAAAGIVSAFARPAMAMRRREAQTVLTGTRFDLTVEETLVNITGSSRMATTVNGSLPAPILRFREGETVTINVTNRLSEDTSIHWHGFRLPADMDGVPGLTFRGIGRARLLPIAFRSYRAALIGITATAACRNKQASMAP